MLAHVLEQRIGIAVEPAAGSAWSNRKPYPSTASPTPARCSALQKAAWFALVTALPRADSSAAMAPMARNPPPPSTTACADTGACSFTHS